MSAPTTTAIIINAAGATDKIAISGVVLDGLGIAGTNGIAFNSGGNLTVSDCVIRNFGNDGILVEPITSNQFFVSNTLVSDNGGIGIAIATGGSGVTAGVLDHVRIENNTGNGLDVEGSTQPINMTVSDSVSANNSNGIFASSNSRNPVVVMARNSTFANNINTGVAANNTGASVSITRSTITNNGTAGWTNNGTGGEVFSYGDNNIDGNATNNSTPGSALPYH